MRRKRCVFKIEIHILCDSCHTVSHIRLRNKNFKVKATSFFIFACYKTLLPHHTNTYFELPQWFFLYSKLFKYVKCTKLFLPFGWALSIFSHYMERRCVPIGKCMIMQNVLYYFSRNWTTIMNYLCSILLFSRWGVKNNVRL